MKLEEAIKSNKFTDEKQKASVNVLYTAYWLKHRFSAAIKTDDLTLEQYNVLRILKGKYPEQMCVKDIGSRIVEKSSNVPRIIDRLVIKKLAKRTPSTEDKRETLVSLTDKGIEALERATILLDKINNSLTCLTDSDAYLLNELLEKLRKE